MLDLLFECTDHCRFLCEVWHLMQHAAGKCHQGGSVCMHSTLWRYDEGAGSDTPTLLGQYDCHNHMHSQHINVVHD